jgi:membrane protease YdiL (CAAX protease family)
MDRINAEVKNLIFFLRYPTEYSTHRDTLTDKFIRLFILLILELGVIFVLSPFLSIILGLFNFDEGEHAVSRMVAEESTLYIFISAVVLAPLIEEIMFRLFLRYRRNYPMLILLYLIKKSGAYGKGNIHILIYRWWRKRFKYIFYASALLFGAIHMSNYDNGDTLFLLFPLFTFPQIVMGLFLGYIRLKQGFIWSVLLHALHNMTLMTFAIMIK